MNGVPTKEFYIIIDTERDMIIASGTEERMREICEILRKEYQSTAYVVRRWVNAKEGD